MPTHSVKKQPKSTIEINVKLTWAEVQEAYKTSFAILHAQFEMVGFRKGKVPMELAEKNIDKDKVYSHLIREIMPKIYENIVKKEDLHPILSPKIELLKAKENEDWELKIIVAEKPEVKLKDYKMKVQEAKKGLKTDDIWVPGKDEKKDPKDENQKKEKSLNVSLEAVLAESECELPPLLIEEELDRRLTQMVDDVQKIGLTMEKYLQTRNLTLESVKERLTKEITDMYKLEFILQAIADEEKLEVKQEDLQALFSNIKEERDRKAAEANAYFYASVLRKQKALDFIIGL
ncbi:MAG: trigger factor [Candidatus Roizmanbacteria bacterium]|nr:trigger factor [Candidatus Roizmanbacteria bacterium]